MEWVGSFAGYDEVGAPASTTTLLTHYIAAPSALQAAFVNPTIVRLRGQLDVKLTAGSAFTGGNALCAVGVIAWKDTNDTTPTGADCPNPASDSEFDWLWHAFLPITVPASGIEYFHFVTGSLAIDSKAMRKLPSPSGLLFVLAVVNTTVGTGATVEAQAGFRCLIKE